MTRRKFRAPLTNRACLAELRFEYPVGVVNEEFCARYGPWALIAGASEGLGAEYARQLAARGLDVLLVARRDELLEQLAQEIRHEFGREARCASLDLASPQLADELREHTAGIEIGLVVYNAAFSLIGPFVEQKLEDKLRILDVNCRGPLVVAHELGPAMLSRGRGGILMMSSLAGFQGSPWLATYAASKAFDTVLAEGLWDEFREHGVDVLACCAGVTRTPNFEKTQPRGGPKPMEPRDVVTEALAALGRRPNLVAGRFNRIACFVMGRLLPRRAAIRIIGASTRRMYGTPRPPL